MREDVENDESALTGEPENIKKIVDAAKASQRKNISTANVRKKMIR